MEKIFFFIRFDFLACCFENESLLVEMIIVAFPLKEKKESDMIKIFYKAGQFVLSQFSL